jgi:lipoprotein-anchoring transpeptidase ErfK/SrfK
MNTRLRMALILLVSAVVGAGAVWFLEGGGDDEAAVTTTTTTLPVTTTEGESTTTTAPPRTSLVAQALTTEIDLYADAASAAPVRTLTDDEATSVPGRIPMVFLAVADTMAPDATRIEVYLPIRPNGSRAFVEVSDVTITPITFRIEVAITEHTIRVFDGNEVVLEEPIGVGTTDRPTPGGIYYIKELLQPPSPDGPYGVYAYGLNGFSNVLTSFAGGEGVIGIHGTNQPDALGTDVSSGCIRLHNDAITRLVQEVGLPLGTPVEIFA